MSVKGWMGGGMGNRDREPLKTHKIITYGTEKESLMVQKNNHLEISE